MRSTFKYFIVPAYPLSGKSNYVVEEFSAERQRAIISWDHYLTTQGEPGSGIPCQFFIERTPTPIPRLETVQSHFQTEAKINNIPIYKL